MRKSISITYNGVDWCSGLCSYCTQAYSTGMTQGVDVYHTLDDLRKSLIEVDERTYSTMQIDFDKMRDAIIQHPHFQEDAVRFIIWGGDPIGSFLCFQEIVAFIEDLKGQYPNKRIDIHCSTNGLAFLREEVVDFIIQHRIGVQLSHDAYGQWIRTRNINPLDFEGTKKLLELGWINCISCVMNFWNCHPLKCVEYFKNHLSDSVYRKITVRLYTVRESTYDIKELNVEGRLDDSSHRSLKNAPLGNVVIRNDYDLAEKYNMPELAHRADDFFRELEYMYRTIDSDDWNPYRKVLIQRIWSNRDFNCLPPFNRGNRPACANYQKGLLNYSDCIDTLGNYTECHLIDSRQQVPNKSPYKPAYCKNCRYRNAYECSCCGAMIPNKNGCQFTYRFFSLIENLLLDRNIRFWMKAYKSNKWPRSKDEADKYSNKSSR